MARTPARARFLRHMRMVRFMNHYKLPTNEGVEIYQAIERGEHNIDRRRFAAAIVATAALPFAGISRNAFGAPRSTNIDVGIVGAGLAGLACAYELSKNGIKPVVYDAHERVGGRCYSMTNFHAGQTIERGSELIDNLHKTMLGYVKEFGLTKENYHRNEGEVVYHFKGQRYPESAVVADYRAFVDAIQGDLRSCSGAPTALSYTPEDLRLDKTNLLEYLDGKNSSNKACSGIGREAIIQSYIAEYGLVPEQQSVLNFILFIHADKRSRFMPFGVFSDERYHIVEGNDRIASGLAERLPNPVQMGMNLVRIARTAAGRTELTFKAGQSTITKTHDQIVLALPFSVLKNVELSESLNWSANKLSAIQNLGYGNNAKMMVGFNGRPWKKSGSSGTSYADLSNCQTTWETNDSKATDKNGVLTDYSGGVRGASLNPKKTQTEAARFLSDLDRVFPGSLAASAQKGSGEVVALLEHWPSNPMTKGSYTCYTPGQFTTVAGHEGTSEGAVHFAGEHTNSFYEWQGFMEGACLSGLAAATKIMAS